MNAKPVVTSYSWNIQGQLYQAQSDVIQKLGYRHHCIERDEPIPPDTKIIIVQGPYGSLVPLVSQLQEYPPNNRPVLIYWFQQSLDFRRPEWLRNYVGVKLSGLTRNFPDNDGMINNLERAFFGGLACKGTRLGYFGDILWLKQHDLLDVLGLSSTSCADYLGNFGIDSMVVPRGYHPSYGSLLNHERDIALVWMGKARTRRRKRAIYWLQEQLKKRGQIMHIYDGEEADFIFGDERTNILNRTWFVLNFFFSGPTDELSIRYYISGANGAVVLTEPGKNRYPFVPGKHVVECDLEDMPDTIMYYLENQWEWSHISRNVFDLISNEITLERTVKKLLDQGELVLNSKDRNE